MTDCWASNPQERPTFSIIRQKLALQLEGITDEYSYLKLDSQKNYYNVENYHRDQLEVNFINILSFFKHILLRTRIEFYIIIAYICKFNFAIFSTI